MLSLDEAIDDQSDLGKLCSARSLETKELFEPNSFYGMNSVIRKYSEIPLNKALKIIFPHGLSFSSNYIWVAEKNANIPCIYFYSPHRYKIYKNETNKVVLPAASPFVYLVELLKKHTEHKRKGTIFFPSHSTHHVTSTIDFEKLAIDLGQLDDKYKPISVCIYWRDYNLGHHKVFKEKGFKIVSAGHMFDPLFLFRLYHLCSMHKYSASNELGSHLFYSVKAGCSFFFMNYKQAVRKAQKNILERDTSTPDQEIVNKLVKLFLSPTDKLTTEQLNTVDNYLGVKNLKTPGELRAELEFADSLDKFGFSRHPENKKMYYRIPNLIPKKLLKNIKNKIEKKFITHST